MNKKQFNMLMDSLNREEPDIEKMKELVADQKESGEISPILRGVAEAIELKNDDLLLERIHLLRLHANYVPVYLVWDSQLWLKYNGKTYDNT